MITLTREDICTLCSLQHYLFTLVKMWKQSVHPLMGEWIKKTYMYIKCLVFQTAKNLPAMWETGVQLLGWKDPLEKGMTTHSSILAGKTP